VVARHHHLHSLRQLHRTRHVGRAEVELRTITLEERRVPAALLLRQYVHLGQELRVRRDRARLSQHHTALDLLLRNTAEQKPHVVARTTLVQELAEHLNARDGRLLLRIEPDQLNFLANLDDPPLDAARRYRTTTRDREHVL